MNFSEGSDEWLEAIINSPDVTSIINQAGTEVTEHPISQHQATDHDQATVVTLIINQAGIGETEHPISQHRATDHDQAIAVTSIINQTGTGETEHPISQHQATRDEAAAAEPSRKKSVRTPLNDEQKKINRRNADQRHREKEKADIQKTREDLETAKRKLEDAEREVKELRHANESLKLEKRKVEQLQRANDLLTEEKKSMGQELQNANTLKGQLQSEIKRLHKDHDEKMKEELRVRKTQNYKREHLQSEFKRWKEELLARKTGNYKRNMHKRIKVSIKRQREEMQDIGREQDRIRFRINLRSAIVRAISLVHLFLHLLALACLDRLLHLFLSSSL
ncbi:trichohyalin-like isoform X1 [Tripterygium wilfordii]|uniref:trichohyalin-like isoform X1 n=1 Tax=Tripterygium wilfordii TaxID=458696 RepID=UPI0018F85376|nr:trichohyalin-like isoform X1 [Tripterygium wilfordii]XP_038696333.1 trichohyalin-like isoform X1 [Tripterygium wilfordii]